MANTEHTINDAIASALRTNRRAWANSAVVSSENTGMLKGGAKRPDVLVIEETASPVVIENEVLPALAVEADALSRLGSQLKANGRKILSAIAIRSPMRLRTKMEHPVRSDLRTATDLDMALYTGAIRSRATPAAECTSRVSRRGQSRPVEDGVQIRVIRDAKRGRKAHGADGFVGGHASMAGGRNQAVGSDQCRSSNCQVADEGTGAQHSHRADRPS